MDTKPKAWYDAQCFRCLILTRHGQPLVPVLDTGIDTAIHDLAAFFKGLVALKVWIPATSMPSGLT